MILKGGIFYLLDGPFRHQAERSDGRATQRAFHYQSSQDSRRLFWRLEWIPCASFRCLSVQLVMKVSPGRIIHMSGYPHSHGCLDTNLHSILEDIRKKLMEIHRLTVDIHSRGFVHVDIHSFLWMSISGLWISLRSLGLSIKLWISIAMDSSTWGGRAC